MNKEFKNMINQYKNKTGQLKTDNLKKYILIIFKNLQKKFN